MGDQERERERLAKSGYLAMMGVLRATRRKPDAQIAPWETVDAESQRGMMAFADAVRAAVLPPDTVAVPRERLARLEAIEAAAREHAESRRAWEEMLPMATDSGVPVGDWDAAQARQDAARTNLLALFAAPTDAAPADVASSTID